MSNDELISKAYEAMKNSYAPYSKFNVGAVALCGEKIYMGCNIENAAYTPTNCAERTAFFKAISQGEREFMGICIVGGKGGKIEEMTAPCGVCRQVMMEFCNPESFEIILAVNENNYKIFKLKEILPLGFGPENIRRKQK